MRLIMKSLFADNFKYFRLLTNTNQKDIARKLNISIQTVSHWETGYSEPSIQQLIDLADLFDTTIDELVDRTL